MGVPEINENFDRVSSDYETSTKCQKKERHKVKPSECSNKSSSD